MVDEQKLRQLAEAATPGHWHRMANKDFGPISQDADQSFGMFIDCGSAHSDEDADYCAAANPAAILSLLDELQTLREERTAWRVTAENSEAIKKVKPVAWMHTMDNTEGIRGNKPYRVLTFGRTNPFGVPGVDYSESYPVTSKPLYSLKDKP